MENNLSRFQEFLNNQRDAAHEEIDTCIMSPFPAAVELIQTFSEGKNLDDMEFDEIDRLMFSGNTFDASIVLVAYAFGIERGMRQAEGKKEDKDA